MNDKMRDFGRQMKEMSGPAAAALAKQMGMTVMQARALADLPMDKGIDKAGKSLKGMYDDIRSPQEKIMTLWHRIGTFLEEKLAKFMPYIEKAIDWIIQPGNYKMVLIALGGLLIGLVLLFRRRLLSVAADFGKTIETATTEGLAMANRKAQIIAANRPQDRGRVEGLMARVQAGPGYAEKKAAGSEFGVMAQGNVFASTKRMLENTERWYSTLANGSRPISLMGVLIDQQNKKLQDSVGFIRQQATQFREYYKTQQQSLNRQQLALDEEEKLVMELKDEGERHYQLNRLADARSKILSEQAKLNDKINAVGKQEDARILRRLRKESPEELANQRRALEFDKQRITAANMKLNIELQDYRNQKNFLEKQQADLKATRQKMEAAGETGEQYMKILNLIKEAKKEDALVFNLMIDTNEKLKAQAQELTGVETAYKRITKAGEQAGKGPGTAGSSLLMSPIRHLGELLKGALNNLGQKITTGAEKTRDSLKATLKSLGAHLNPVNWMKSIVGKIREDPGGAAKGTMNFIGKIAGFLLKLLVLLGIMEPVQKIVGMIVKALKPLMDSLIAILLPAIMKILSGLWPILKVLITFLLPPLVKILGAAVWIIGQLIRGIGALVSFFTGKHNLISDLGDDMTSAGKDIFLGTDTLSGKVGKLTDVLDESTQEKTPGEVGVRKGAAVITKYPGMNAAAQASVDTGAEAASQAKKTADNTAALLQAQIEANKKLEALIQTMGGSTMTGNATMTGYYQTLAAAATRQGQQNTVAKSFGAGKGIGGG
jgi:hypothetical protein